MRASWTLHQAGALHAGLSPRGVGPNLPLDKQVKPRFRREIRLFRPLPSRFLFRSLSRFPLPVLLAGLFLILGMGQLGLWSPALAQEPAAAAPGEHPAPAATESAAGEHAPAAAEQGHAEGEHGGGHTNPVAALLAAIILILLLAKIAGDLFERIGLPAVLGELSVGVILGNIELLTGWGGLQFLHAPAEGSIGDPYQAGAALKMLAEIGVVLLLFEVGLESTVGGMMKVGLSSFVVATLGVVAPIILGIGVGWALLHDEPWQVWLFLGATLCATSVGITARVLKDLGRSQQRESQIILGAAVIDDVMGLVVLAVVSGIIKEGANFSVSSLAWIVVYAVGFLFGAILLGSHLLTKPLFKAATYLKGHGLLVTTALVICFE
jgi:hypothetical protein